MRLIIWLYRFFLFIGLPCSFSLLLYLLSFYQICLYGRIAPTDSEDRIRTWFDTNYTLITQRERVYLAPVARHFAVEQVLRYYRRHNGDWSHIRQAEVDVSLVKEHYILAGKVDLIAGWDDTVELVDFKSERKLDVNDPKDRDKLNQYRRQLEVYAHIVEQRSSVWLVMVAGVCWPPAPMHPGG